MMKGPQKAALAALAVAAVAGGTATGLATAVPASGATPTLTAFSTTLDDYHRWDRDHGRWWDGRRDRDDGWDGQSWRWWHNWGISPDLCRDGGGHVVGDGHRCEGGRFDDFHVR